MNIRLLNGDVIPSKRQNKNISGRQGRKTWNARRAEQAVGGMRDSNRAIAMPVGYEMCVVVDPSKKRFTTSLGGSTPCGYVGGRGA